jgi:hypothetical protein
LLLSTKDAFSVASTTTNWQPLPVTQFHFGRHALTLSKSYILWASWRGFGESDFGVVGLAQAISEEFERTGGASFYGGPELEHAARSWIRASPPRPTGFEVEDPALVMTGGGVDAWSCLEADLLTADLFTFGGTHAYVLPRAAALDATMPAGAPRPVALNLVGTLFADESEADTALALWKPGSREPLGSFTQAREVALAL